VNSAWPPTRVAPLLRNGNGEPEIAHLRIKLFDPSFFRPEGRVFRESHRSLLAPEASPLVLAPQFMKTGGFLAIEVVLGAVMLCPVIECGAVIFFQATW